MDDEEVNRRLDGVREGKEKERITNGLLPTTNHQLQDLIFDQSE